jgi:p-aminobenzoyl-glutamate transporter AbgT
LRRVAFAGPVVPSLFRFLFVVALIAGLVYGAMVALVTYVQVQPREMTQTIPPSKLGK